MAESKLVWCPIIIIVKLDVEQGMDNVFYTFPGLSVNRYIAIIIVLFLCLQY